MYQFSKENVQSGIALYQRAIAADDEFASAHAGLAVGYLILVGANLSENADEDIDHALESARRSVVLDDQDPFCHYALGRAEAFSFNHAKAESELKQAISMHPSYAHAYHGLAHLFFHNQLIFVSHPGRLLSLKDKPQYLLRIIGYYPSHTDKDHV